MTESIGSRLRQAREAAGFSQSQLARTVGVSPQAVQHIEAGHVQRSRYLNQFARALKVDAYWLETGIIAADQQQTEQIHDNRPGLPTATAESYPEIRLSTPTSLLSTIFASPLLYEDDPVLLINKEMWDALYDSNPKKYSDEEKTARSRSASLNTFFTITDTVDHFEVERPRKLDNQSGCYAIYGGMTRKSDLDMGGSEIYYCRNSEVFSKRPRGLGVLWLSSRVFTIGNIFARTYNGRISCRMSDGYNWYFADFDRSDVVRADEIVSIDLKAPDQIIAEGVKILAERRARFLEQRGDEGTNKST